LANLKSASILDVKLNHLLIGYICINAIINAISFLTGIYYSKKMNNLAKVKSLLGCYLVSGAGKNHENWVSKKLVLITWYFNDVIVEYNGFFVLAIGSINSLLVWKVIISTVCGVTFPWNFYEGLVPYAFLFAIAYLQKEDAKSSSSKSLTASYLPSLVWTFLSIATVMFLSYSVSVINQIATKLKISVLLVPKEIIQAGSKKSQ
jgi:hypothetical protein